MPPEEFLVPQSASRIHLASHTNRRRVMMSQPYVDGVTYTVTHNIASSLTAGQITARQGTLTVSVVCPDRWFFGDFAVVTSRDGRAFTGEVEAMDVCTGEVTIKGAR
jgi:hypothetical protein